MRAAVIGHLEWVDFMQVERMPASGDIVHATHFWEEPGGGGPGAAVQLHKLRNDTRFFTALGDDELGHRALDDLTARGLRVEAVFRSEPTRRAITHIDAAGERTITVLGERLAPQADDPLPWEALAGIDVVYFTAGDIGALRWARRARVLVATARILAVLAEAKVELDALVGSAIDPSEPFHSGDLDPPPRLAVWTTGAEGGLYSAGGGPATRYAPTHIQRPIIDRYGAGDSFAAGLANGLAAGEGPEGALRLAARCGAAALTGPGPYGGQLQSSDFTYEAKAGSTPP